MMRLINYSVMNYLRKKNYDVLVFHINYLKHNTRMAFPSILIFNEVPEFIDYEMTSKHSPDIIKGKIEFD